MADLEVTLTLVEDRQRLHCTGHDPTLLLGEWPAAEEWDPGIASAIEETVRQHLRGAHPERLV